MLKPNDTAPVFDLTDQDGNRIRLTDFLGRKHVVLYFYPRDNTPGCTVEACTFRDNYESIEASDAVIIGVSKDPEARHKKFAEKHAIPFHLLTDKTGQTIKAYRAQGLLGYPARVTYVIHKEGKIIASYKDAFNPAKHAQEVLNALHRIQSGSSTK